jgi:predicted nucleic acid-binding protein
LFRPNLKDENDNMFVELAIVSQSKFLITNNIKDFVSGELIFDNF